MNSPHHNDIAAEVKAVGLGIVPEVFDHNKVKELRRTVLAHRDLMKNTRTNRSSKHLAGFHRFPSLEPLHVLITGQPRIQSVLQDLCGEQARTIGLSDITINRSQQWHKDLLRGKYTQYLDTENICAKSNGKVFKVLVYLQNSSSLQFIEGSHRRDISLENDEHAIPNDESVISRVSVSAGDIVVMDICTTHRGATEEESALPKQDADSRILISTVYGKANCDFTDKMELGNTKRQIDWTNKHASHDS